MRLVRLVSPEGLTVLASVDVDDREATPIATCSDDFARDELRDLLAAGTDLASLQPVGDSFPVDRGIWRAPLRFPTKIVAIGLNYADHAREAQMEIPTEPMLFAKFPNAIIGPNEPIRFRRSDSTEVDYECELAAIIGTRTRDVAVDRALEVVFGYTVCNDVSARDAQFSDGQFSRAKSFDSFCPLGPAIVTADEIPDPQDLAIRTRLNGQTVQDSTTGQMIFSVAELISYLSRFMTLEPGDVIATGTPAGVGMARRPPLYLDDGDVIEVEVDGIGILSNPVQVV
jgi:2-keto-4-pentenoate hydratase/2-oxohepta-3-ene-1,7-dioic acid hydratase in catechol pathway